MRRSFLQDWLEIPIRKKWLMAHSTFRFKLLLNNEKNDIEMQGEINSLTGLPKQFCWVGLYGRNFAIISTMIFLILNSWALFRSHYCKNTLMFMALGPSGPYADVVTRRNSQNAFWISKTNLFNIHHFTRYKFWSFISLFISLSDREKVWNYGKNSFLKISWFHNVFWVLWFGPKYQRISALASKKMSNQKNKGTLLQ